MGQPTLAVVHDHSGNPTLAPKIHDKLPALTEDAVTTPPVMNIPATDNNGIPNRTTRSGKVDPTTGIRWGDTVVIVGNKMSSSFSGGSFAKLMDALDNMQMEALFNTTAPKQTYSWTNRNTQNQYTVNVLPPYNDEGTVCREYSVVAYIDKDQQNFKGKACKDNVGEWQFLG